MRTAKQPFRKSLKIWTSFCKGWFGIRRQKAIVDENFQFAAIELELPCNSWLSLQTLACDQSRARCLRQTVLILAIQFRLPVVSNAEAVIGVVHAVVSLVADQDHSRTVGNVLVIGDVE